MPRRKTVKKQAEEEELVQLADVVNPVELRDVELDKLFGLDNVKDFFSPYIAYLKSTDTCMKMLPYICLCVLFDGKSGVGKHSFLHALAKKHDLPIFPGEEACSEYQKNPTLVIPPCFMIFSCRTPDNVQIIQKMQLSAHVVAVVLSNNDCLISTDFAAYITPQVLSDDDRGKMIAAMCDQSPVFVNVDQQEVLHISLNRSLHEIRRAFGTAFLVAQQNKSEVSTRDLCKVLFFNNMDPKMHREICSEKMWRVAIHESGHVLIMRLFSLPNIMSTIIGATIWGTNDFGACVYERPLSEALMGRADMKHKVAVYLGGMEAEYMMFSDYSAGCSDDLDNIRRWSSKIVEKYCFGARISASSHRNDCSQEEKKLREDLIESYIDNVRRSVRDFLTTNREKLKALADALYQRGWMPLSEIAAIIDPEPTPPPRTVPLYPAPHLLEPSRKMRRVN